MLSLFLSGDADECDPGAGGSYSSTLYDQPPQQQDGGGGGTPPSPPPTCDFTSSTVGTATAGVGQYGRGVFNPVSLTFVASGGNGIYSWSGQQTETRFGSVTYTDGTTASLNATINEAVLFGNGTVQATPTTTGPTATAVPDAGLGSTCLINRRGRF